MIGVKYFSVRGQLLFPFCLRGRSRARGGGNVGNARTFSKDCGKRCLLSISPSFPRLSWVVYDSSLAFLACSTR